MKLYERAFFVGEQTEITFDTYKQVLEILESSAGLSYPRFRCQRTSANYQDVMGSGYGREKEVLDVRRQLGPKQTDILVNPIPYTNVGTVREGQVLHACLWSVRSQKLSEGEVGEIIQDVYGNSVCAWIMENLEINKTIPEIQHLHAFIIKL